MHISKMATTPPDSSLRPPYFGPSQTVSGALSGSTEYSGSCFFDSIESLMLFFSKNWAKAAIACCKRAMAPVSSFKAFLNSATSAFLSTSRSSMSALDFLIEASRTSIASPRRSSSLPKCSMLFEAFSMAWSRSSMSFWFLPSEFSHLSRCSMSDCSSARKTSIIVSSDEMTLSKCPPDFSVAASRAKLRSWKRWARPANLL
mmetsp:Transcript_120857/g.385938  ORF Transcript_120857/g.385938 Transcript_120857/m.385938 type:complete len:202 (+) Transcript_120857:452-1057(+)